MTDDDVTSGGAPTRAGSAQLNLADLVAEASATSGARPALISADGTRTWAELDAAARHGAVALAEAGYRPGDRAVLALATGPDLAAALFAVLRAGLVAVPVHPHRSDIEWVAQRVGAVVTVAEHAADAPTPVLTPAAIAGWWRSDAPAGDGTDPASAPRAAGEDLAILARAARSGPPVMLSHRALCAAAKAVHAAPGTHLRPDDRVLQLLPLYHVLGLVTAFLLAAQSGASVVIPAETDPATAAEAALESIERHRVSILPAEPTLYRQLDRVAGFERRLATVRMMTSSSSPLDPADFVAIRAATGQAVREGYGISEAASAVTSTLMTPTAHPGSVGLPYVGVEVRIDGGSGSGGSDSHRDVETDQDVDSADHDGDTLAEVSTDGNDVGRIAIRGATLFSGYWPDGEGGPEEDGWFVTGDIGYLDQAGELHLVDRADETITVQGFTVYPREVEDVLVTHPYIADAAVVGVPGRSGMTVVAALVPTPGTRPTADDVDEFIDGKLAPFKRPGDYQIVSVLPRTEVGRLDRDAVRAAYLSAHPRVDDSATDEGAGDDPAPDLEDLGRKLPATGPRGRGGADDTDEDLF